MTPRAPRRSEVLTTWRRMLFSTWIIAGLVAAAFAMIGGPIMSSDGASGTALIALVSPLAMLIFIVSGLAWLMLLISSKRESPKGGRSEPSTSP